MKKENKNQTTEQLILKPLSLPDTNFDLIEQLAFAFQNRDAIGLKQILHEHIHELGKWNSRAEFIQKFIGYCDKLERIHDGGIYVNTVPGHCGNERCEYGKSGLGVTVSTIKGNKLLWSFNLVPYQMKNGQLGLNKCRLFEVDSEEIPF